MQVCLTLVLGPCHHPLPWLTHHGALTGHGSVWLGGQVDGGIPVGAPADAVARTHVVAVGLGGLEVLNQEHALPGVVDFHLLGGADGLCGAAYVKNPLSQRIYFKHRARFLSGLRSNCIVYTMPT